MDLTPTHYVNILNHDCNFIKKKKAAGSIDIIVYVSVPLTGQDVVVQIYEFTGMLFPVEPVFLSILSPSITISPFRKMT
jgi:hypothetical protein